MCIRVLIADDQTRSRHSLKALLTAMRWGAPSYDGLPTPAGLLSVEIVGEAEDGQTAISQVEALQPNVVLMDLHPHPVSAPKPRLDVTAAVQMIKSRWPAIQVVVLTMYATDRASALAAGADAFLLKGCPTREILDAIMPRPADP